MNIYFENLAIGYSKNNVLVSGINIVANSGDIVVISGENGIGKTTLLNTILGLQGPISGKLSLMDVGNIGFLGSESLTLFPFLTGLEILNFFEDINDSILSPDAKKLTLYTEIMNRKYQDMSSGMKQLLKLFITSLENKKIIVWDEPLRGLADAARFEIINYTKKISSDKIIIITEHTFRGWDRFCTQAFTIRDKKWFSV
jgi:zinc transport system ATP-binding protein